MRKPRLEELVMSSLFPQRKDVEFSDWQTYVRRCLVPEVRSESICFYGHSDCLEAQYPGLDYANPAHRLRLNQFPSHKRLFGVLDKLRLTNYEIQRLCVWEGTRWVRELYELKNKIKIMDTTWNDIYDFRNRSTTATVAPAWIEEEDGQMRDSDEGDGLDEGESEDELQRSVGVDLNQRLLIATEARARGENAVIDTDWEQWLKQAVERGGLVDFAQHSSSLINLAAPLRTSWGQEIPVCLSADPVNLRARLPRPQQVEANSVIATSVTAPPPAHPAGATR